MLRCRVCAVEVEKHSNGKRCRSCYNAYMAEYMLKRYHERRVKAVAAFGGKCIRCGSDDQLEFDHKERALKRGEIAKLLTRGEGRYLKEMEKCQLLCRSCHIKKTSSESTVGHGGGLTGVRNCYCDLCRPVKNAYNREWKRRRKEQNTIP